MCGKYIINTKDEYNEDIKCRLIFDIGDDIVIYDSKMREFTTYGGVSLYYYIELIKKEKLIIKYDHYNTDGYIELFELDNNSITKLKRVYYCRNIKDKEKELIEKEKELKKQFIEYKSKFDFYE